MIEKGEFQKNFMFTGEFNVSVQLAWMNHEKWLHTLKVLREQLACLNVKLYLNFILDISVLFDQFYVKWY